MVESSTLNNAETHLWRNGVGRDALPKKRDLLLKSGSQATARPVTFSKKIQQNINYAMDNPIDFVTSTATSMATFMVVKSFAIQALLGVALGPFATPIVAGMLAAALITSVRATVKQTSAAQERVAQLTADTANPPSAEALSVARKVNVSNIIGAGAMHGLFSGLVGSLFGFMALEVMSDVNAEPDVTTPPAEEPTVDGGAVVDGGVVDAGNTKINVTSNLTYDMGGTFGNSSYSTIIVEDFKDVLIQQDAQGGGVLTQEGYALTLNGPLFDNAGSYVVNGQTIPTRYGETVGMLIVDGDIQRPFVDPSLPRFDIASGGIENFADENGIMGKMTNGDPFVMTALEWKTTPIPADKIDWAFQNGGVLLDQDGTYSVTGSDNVHNPNNPMTSSLKERTAMGFNAEGDLVIIHADKVNNYHLGQIAAQHGAVDAMFLDGANVGYSLPSHDIEQGTILDNSTVFHIR
ncbi:MAG: phosphodiester glycosidase family protein [Rickettsiales bacterium]|nr:phosphodiester glycosidase family protein [Rickettsiales bacterium]